MTGEYEPAMKESVLPLLAKVSADHAPAVRQQLADLCGHVMTARIAAQPPDEEGHFRTSLGPADLELLRHLLQLASDTAPEVAERGFQVSQLWGGGVNVALPSPSCTKIFSIPPETARRCKGVDGVGAQKSSKSCTPLRLLRYLRFDSLWSYSCVFCACIFIPKAPDDAMSAMSDDHCVGAMLRDSFEALFLSLMDSADVWTASSR